MRRLRTLLGTYVAIDVEDRTASAETAIMAAFEAIERVQRLMSVHTPDSDLSRINREAWRQPVAVDRWTARTLRWALRLHTATDGLFDCVVGHELGRWRLVPGCDFTGSQPGRSADVEVSPDGLVRLARRVALDLGGIAKGFAVDRAIAALRAHGVRSAAVNAGGDLRVMGHASRPIHIRAPGDGIARLAGVLANGACATSAATAIIAVGDRVPLRRTLAYSVVAPSCTVADALTKAVAQSERTTAPWLTAFGAIAFVTRPSGAP